MPGTHRAAVRSPRRWLITAVVVGLAAALVGPVGADDNAVANGTYDLFAGQDLKVGTVSVSNDLDTIYVEFALDSPWCMTESHVDVVANASEFPTTKKGNPIPGQFASSWDHDCTMGATHEFAMGSFSAVHIAAHAEVWDTSSVAEVTFSSADTGNMTGFGRFNDYDTATTSTVASLIRTLLESEENVAWNDSIASPWVTIDFDANPDIDQWFRVDHAIVVDGLPSGDGSVMVNSDNADEVLGYTSVTGKPGAITGDPIRPAHDRISQYTFPVTEGENVVRFVVRNYFPTSTGPNPMALTYSGSVEYYEVEESAWAGSIPFPGANWATYFQYTPYDGTVWLCDFDPDLTGPPYGDDRNGDDPGFFTVQSGVEAGTFLVGDYIVRYNTDWAAAWGTPQGLNQGQINLCHGNGGAFAATKWSDLPTDGSVQLIEQNLTNGYPIGWDGP